MVPRGRPPFQDIHFARAIDIVISRSDPFVPKAPLRAVTVRAEPPRPRSSLPRPTVLDSACSGLSSIGRRSSPVRSALAVCSSISAQPVVMCGVQDPRSAARVRGRGDGQFGQDPEAAATPNAGSGRGEERAVEAPSGVTVGDLGDRWVNRRKGKATPALAYPYAANAPGQRHWTISWSLGSVACTIRDRGRRSRAHLCEHAGSSLVRSAFAFVSAGQRIGVVGINGSGKSTLLRVLAGAIEPESGFVRRGRGVRISYLDQDPVLAPGTVRDAIGNGWESEAVAQRLGMGAELTTDVSRLSGGQAKRVALAALAQPAELLVLDEPTNHLDLGAVRGLRINCSHFEADL